LIYDRIGPRLARRLRHPLAADLAFLSLKPAEWATRATLGLLLGDLDDHVARIYKSTSE